MNSMGPVKNTDPPEVRCGMCGGKCRIWKPGWIECVGKDQPYPFQNAGRCFWSSHDKRRRRFRLYWRYRVWRGR